jgi:tetratricopeptide (TPR) repeat protein
MAGSGRTQGPTRCGQQPCETVIFQLLHQLERTPKNWKLRYQLGFCYSGRCQNHSLVSPDLALEHLSSASKNFCDPQNPQQHAAILSLLGLMYERSKALPRRVRLLCAVECQEKAADIHFTCGAFREWACIQYNLGNTWCEFPDDEFPAKWGNAIAHYEQALRFRNSASDRASFAATLENLGTAYRQLPTGDKAANVHKAIQCYRRAVRLCPVACAPAQWAALQNNLGNACLSLPFADVSSQASHARHAILHFDLALKVRTSDRDPFGHAVTTLNRGQACLQLARAGDATWLSAAAQCFRDANAAFLRTGAATEAILARDAIASVAHALNSALESHCDKPQRVS